MLLPEMFVETAAAACMHTCMHTCMHAEWAGMTPPTAVNAQPYHHLPNTTSQYRLVLCIILRAGLTSCGNF